MAKKITKKERKLANPSKQRELSINNGTEHKFGERVYFGKNPEYQLVGNQMIKTANGVPFVRVS